MANIPIWPGSSSFTTGTNDVDVFSFVTFDGSTWYGTGLKNFS